MDNEVINENKEVFKQAIRSKIFNSSELMQENLQKETEFVFSTQHPTQVLDIKGTRYIRVNTEDIMDDTIDDLLSTMLGIQTFKGEDETAIDKQQVLMEAIKANQELDGNNLMESSSLFDFDEYNNIKNLDDIPIQPQIIMVKSEEEQKKDEEQQEQELENDIEENGDFTQSAKQLNSAMNDEITDEAEQQIQEQQYQVEHELEQLLQEVESVDDLSMFNSSYSILSAQEISALDKKAKQLLKAFRGIRGKDKKITPAKRTCAKSMAMDKDKVYYAKSNATGKHIHMNFIVDMSGSMSGTPVKNAVSLIYIFNQLAKQGYLDMHVLYSESYNYKVLKLPANDAYILAFNETGGAEGLTRTINANIDILRDVNLICLTDGNLADEPIKKTFWNKHHIVSTGVYVNKQAKNLTEYTGSLNRWFNHSLVRPDLNSLIETLIRMGLK